MGDFELIEAGFCNADETINFGTRTCASESLYEMSTLICFKTDNKHLTGVSDVMINTIMKNGLLYFSNGKHLKVFRCPEFRELIFNASLGNDIICMAVYPDQQLVAVCLDTGVFKLLKINENGEFTSIFSGCLHKGAIPRNLYAYDSIEDSNGCIAKFLVVFKDGIVFRISVQEALVKENQFEVVNEELFNLTSTVNLSSFLHPFLITSGSCCNLLNTETREVISFDLPFQVKKIFPLGCKFLYLDFEGKLRKLCSLTMKSFTIDYDCLLEDILVLQDGKILAVTKPNELGNFYLQLLETGFKQAFSLKLKEQVHLVDVNSTTDDLLFLSFIMGQSERITELRLKTVYETEPESRFNRLVKRQRFEEAEAFAKTFNLDPTVVLKAKAESIVDKTKCDSEEINLLIELMDSINESYFSLQCCMNVEYSSFDVVRKILKYASKISPESLEERKEKKKLMDLLFRYETFNVLLKYKVESDMQSWIRFAVCDLLEEVKDCLENFQIEDAIIIYSRMDEETVKSLNEKFVNDVLDIFKNLPQDLYQSFLPTFFPITMTHLPSAMSLFVTWLQDKILHMEKRDATNFPENGVKMVEDVLELIRVEKHGGLLRQCMLNRKSLENLSNLLKGLKTLHKLKKMYAIKVELSEYLEGPKKFVSTLLRVSMPPELYNGFLKNFLQIYMLQNDIDHSTIFAEEINNLLKCNGDWLSTIEIIFDNISSLDIKLQITQELLLNSPVPWCDAVKRMADRSLQFSHPMVETISKMLSNEARYKVIQNREYLINERKLDEQFCRVVNRIVYVDEPQMVDDIFHLCSIDDQYLNATFILVNHFILKEDLDQAIAMLNRNKPEILHRCGRSLFEYAENIIKARYHKASTKEKYYNFLPILIKKLIKNGGYKEWEMHHAKERFRIMQGQYFFKQHFGIDFTDAEFKSPMEIIQSIDLASRDFTEILQYAEHIAFFLSKDTDEILLQLCDSIKKFDILIKAGEYLYETDSSAKNLCLITMLFLKYLGIQNCSQLHTTVFEKIHDQTLPTFDNLNCLDETSENDKFLKGLKLGYKLITKAMVKDGTDLQINKVSRWLDVCFSLIRPNSTLHDYLHPNVYCPKQIMPSSTVLQTIQFCFEGIFSRVDVHKDSEYYSVFPSNMELEEELLTETSINTTLASAIDTFCREGQALTAYSLLTTVANSLVLHPSQEISVLKPLKLLLDKKCLVQLINAVVSAEHIDLELLYNLFLAMPQDYKQCLTYFLQTHRRNFRKLKDLSRVGIELLDSFKDTEGREIMIDAVKSCKWWSRLAPVHSKMIYTEFFKSVPDARLKLVINLDAVGFEEINSYCKDFNLDVDEYYREYLKSSLLNFTPQYKIEKMRDKKVLIVENNEDSLYKKCQKIIKSIKDKARAFLDMVNILKEVNFYYYEVFLTIYKLLEDNTQTTYSEDKKMVLFLKEYTRFGRPSQREKEAWYITFPDTQILDPLSELRVPFIPLLFSSEIWSILRPEVSLTSYKLWFNATSILINNLKVDDICVYAVKNVVSSGILGTYVPNDWKLYSEFDDLLHKVDECVQNIKNLESATSVVYELMNNIPNGADKVKAAELSLKYAVQYRGQNMNNSEVEKTFKKLTNNFYSLSVRHVLHRYNLNKEIYLKLVTQPEILIENLYTDERVSKQTVSLSLDYSDINDAVDAISELFGLDVGNIRFSLLKRWLSSPNDFDITLTLSPFKNNSFNRVEDDDNLKRAIYICNSRNQQHLETYLLEVVLTEDDLDVSDRNMVFKANAAKCFCAITDEARIIEVTKLSYDEFLKYVDKLALLSELESLGIMLNIETLNVMSKKELLKKLSHMGKPLAIKCMGAVCMTYFLEEHKYWEYIINCSIKFGMIADLKTYVDFLKNKCDKQFYINAWQVIIDKTFQELIHVSNEDLEKTLINNFLMIQSCPVVFSLNFEKIIEITININKKEYAALILQYMTEEKRSNVIKEGLFHETDFTKLKNKGLWGVHNLNTNKL